MPTDPTLVKSTQSLDVDETVEMSVEIDSHPTRFIRITANTSGAHEFVINRKDVANNPHVMTSSVPFLLDIGGIESREIKKAGLVGPLAAERYMFSTIFFKSKTDGTVFTVLAHL